MDLEQNKKCTKQTQTSEQPRKMAQTQTTEQLSSSTPNSDTDSVYNTESDSNDAAHLPRPSYMPKPTKNNSTTSHLSTSTHQPKLSTPTASTYHQRTRKTLLPTPPAPVRNFNYRNHYKQHIPGPTSRYSTYPTFTRPSPFYNTYPTFSRPSTVISRPPPRNNHRFCQNSYIPRPHNPEFNTQQPPLLPRPPYQCQNIMTGPYQQHQQTQGHYTQQVSLPPYVPIIILTTIQPDQQRLSTANKTLQPEPTITDKQNII